MSWTSGTCSYDGTRYVVLWEDGANLEPTMVRYTPTGVLLDAAGIPVSGASSTNSIVSAANGESFAAWTYVLNGLLAIEGERVRSDGSILDAQPISLTTTPSSYPALSHDEQNFFVAWPDLDGGLRGVFVPLDGGSPLNSFFVGIDGGARLSATYDGANYHLFFVQNDQTLEEVELSRTGQVLGMAPNIASFQPGGVVLNAVSSGDGGSLVVYDCNYRQTCLAVLDPGGLVTSSQQVVGTSYTSQARLTSTSAQPLAAWSEDLAKLNDALVGWDGGFASEVRPMSIGLASEIQHTAAWGEHAVVAWADLRNQSDYDVYAARLDPDVGSLDPTGVPIAIGGGDQLRPAMAYGAGEFLVAWEDWDSGVPLLAAARLTEDGGLVDQGHFVISSAGPAESPAVVFDGTNFVVAWEDSRGAAASIYVARVATDGSLLDDGGIAVSATTGDHYSPALTATPLGTYVAWQEFIDGGSRISGVVFSTAGGVTPLGNLTPLSSAAADPSLSAGDGGVLLVWSESTGQTSQIRAARIEDGGQGSPFGVSATGSTTYKPKVIYDGHQWLVSWLQVYPPTGEPEVFVDNLGSVEGWQTLTMFPFDPSLRIALTSDGAGTSVLVVSVPTDPSEHRGTGLAVTLKTAPFVNGVACDCDSLCGAGLCVDGVCCESDCDRDAGTTRCSACNTAGASGSCRPRDAGTICRWPVGACDVPETCDGTQLECPPDVLAPSSTVCRNARDEQCDVAEFCDGGVDCPADVTLNSGMSCQANLCVLDAVCSMGDCTGHPVVCNDDPCRRFSYCQPQDGGCNLDSALPDGTACTIAATCQTGTCLHGSCDAGLAQACPDAPCQLGVCAGDGQCSTMALPDGTGCDGGFCRQGLCIADSGVDAGSDGGVDAGRDAGFDGGEVADAGAPADGGSPVPPTHSGCGCSSGSATSVLALLLVQLARRRRAAVAR